MLALAAIALAGCSNDIEKVHSFDRTDNPVQVVKDATVTRTSNGNRQMRLSSPLIKRYGQPDIRTLYPKGVELIFLSPDGSPKAWLKADSAISYDDREIMQAYGNVVAIDYHTGDTTYMHRITWNQVDGHIFSDTTVRSVNGHRVTYGDGFDSDESMDNLHVIHQRGTIEIND